MRFETYSEVKAEVESVEGALCLGQEQYLFNKVKSLPEDAVIVEIGAYKGRSTTAMAFACVGTSRRIHSMDTWQGRKADTVEAGLQEAWQENINRNNLDPYVTPHNGRSEDLLRQWHEAHGEESVDFVFIDGSHDYEDVLSDFQLSLPLVKQGGCIAFHDVDPTWPGPKKVWESNARDVLGDHEFVATLACGRKLATGNLSPRRDCLSNSSNALQGTRDFDKSEKGARAAYGAVSLDSLDRFRLTGAERAAGLLVSRVVKLGMTAFDIGAHKGDYTLLLSSLVGPSGNVITFEPTPSSTERLESSIEQNGLENVRVEKQAVHRSNGTVQLNTFSERYSSWNTLGNPVMADATCGNVRIQPSGCVETTCVRLDDYCKANEIDRINFLKVDVSGSEEDVFYGASRLLEEKAIDLVVFEVSKDMLKGQHRTARAVFDSLGARGYECYRIKDSGRFGDRVEDTDARWEVFAAVPSVPVHFFTIVLNGMPYIRHHVEQFSQLPFDWHWHIVEGVADYKHETGDWAKKGGQIKDDMHASGLSRDGTTQYLDDIKARYPDKITIYRKGNGGFWDGKLEMVSAPLRMIREECLLWQVDSDELWTAGQIEEARRLFQEDRSITAAFYRCSYFVGPKLVISTDDTYGNNHGEWLRTWRFLPGSAWASHAPPILCQRDTQKQWKNVAATNPVSRGETERRGLVFQHYAYADASQLEFKEDYYGYQGALAHWRKLQEQDRFPQLLRNFFPWVKDGAIVQTADACGVSPLATIAADGSWQMSGVEAFPASGSPSITQLPRKDAESIVWLRPDAIGDGVLASSMLSHVRRNHPKARISVVCEDHIAELYHHCPHVDAVIPFNRKLAITQDARYLRSLTGRLNSLSPDLLLNSVYSPEPLTHFLVEACQPRESVAFLGGLECISPDARDGCRNLYSHLLPNGPRFLSELERNKAFLDGIGIKADGLQPEVWITDDDRAFARTIFQKEGLQQGQTIALFCGAQDEKKFYERYGAALAGALPDGSFTVIALGGEQHRELNQRNLADVGVRSLNLSGKTSLRQSAALLELCSLAVGADTGLAHMACAVGTRNVILLGGGHFGRFMPYSSLTSVVCLPLQCYGCNWVCKYETPHCIKGVSQETLRHAIHCTLNSRQERPRVYAQASSCWKPDSSSPKWRWPEEMIADNSAEVSFVGGPSPDEEKLGCDDSAADHRAQMERVAPVRASGKLVSICVISNSGLPGNEKRRSLLKGLLGSIKSAGFPLNAAEVIVAGAAAKMPVGVRTLEMQQEALSGQVCAMRNAAVRASSGQLIIHCDDDVLFTPGYWDAISAAIQEDWDILCTRLLNPNGTRYWDWAAYEPGKGQTLLPYDVSNPHVFSTGGHAVYRRRAFDHIAWNESLKHGDNEEYDLAEKARAAGLKYRMCTEATAFLQYHHCDAEAVIQARSQQGTGNHSDAFVQACESAGIRLELPKDHGEAALLSRIGHKIPDQSASCPDKPSVSVLVCCHRYLQRFRVFAESLIRQHYPKHKLEVVVANPHSPDGLSEYISLLDRACSAGKNGDRRGPSFKEFLADEQFFRNRGYLIQRAFEHSSGEIVLGMDCDLVLPPDFINRVASTVCTHPDRVVGVYRNFLSPESTDRILSGLEEPWIGFKRLLAEDRKEDQGYRGVLGYCQALRRSEWKKVGYPEGFDEIAKSDVAFVERLKNVGVTPLFLPDLRVLHLHHERDWSGTKSYL